MNMEPFVRNSTIILWVLVALSAVLVVAIIALIRRFSKRESLLSDRLNTVESSLNEQLKHSQEQSNEQAGRAREEMSNNLRGMGDSVTRVMGEMARTQQSQLDAFATQLRDMGRVDEARMGDMQKSVEDRMDRISTVLDDKLDRNEQRLERMRQTVSEQMTSMQEGNNLRLEQMHQSVDERLNKTLESRLGESFRIVSQRLEQVYQGLGEIESLASGVGDLKKVLTGVKTRGTMGEIQLGGLLSQLMTSEQYAKNFPLSPNGESVDYAIILPGRASSEPACYLPIDARFPHEAYYRLLDAQDGSDSELIQQLSDEFDQKLIMTAHRIQEQFIFPPQTTDFAVLFLSSEGLYAEVLKRQDLVEQLQRDHHVMLTGPSTLAALLNSLQMGFKTMAIEKRSEEVWALLGAVRGEFSTFADALARTQKRIRQADESIQDVSRKSRAITRTLKGVDKLPGAKREQLLNTQDIEDDDEDELGDTLDWD